MKKVVYFIPVIILTIYAIIYLPLLPVTIDISNRLKDPHELYSVSYIMDKITIGVIACSIILKILLKSNKFDINKSLKIINTVSFILLVFIIYILRTIAAFA